jgi:aldehyde dehydrogenase (NAD+)
MRKVRTIGKLFINNEFVGASKGGTFQVLNPATEGVLETMPKATSEDVDQAVKAARKAFDQGPWGKMGPAERAGCMYRLADLVEKNMDELAYLESLSNGKPYAIAKAADLVLTHRCYRYYAGMA